MKVRQFGGKTASCHLCYVRQWLCINMDVAAWTLTASQSHWAAFRMRTWGGIQQRCRYEILVAALREAGQESVCLRSPLQLFSRCSITYQLSEVCQVFEFSTAVAGSFFSCCALHAICSYPCQLNKLTFHLLCAISVMQSKQIRYRSLLYLW